MTAEEIRNQAIARRTQAGLKLVLQTPDGLTTLYPKDRATRDQWLKAAIGKGYSIVTDDK